MQGESVSLKADYDYIVMALGQEFSVKKVQQLFSLQGESDTLLTPVSCPKAGMAPIALRGYLGTSRMPVYLTGVGTRVPSETRGLISDADTWENALVSYENAMIKEVGPPDPKKAIDYYDLNRGSLRYNGKLSADFGHCLSNPGEIVPLTDLE